MYNWGLIHWLSSGRLRPHKPFGVEIGKGNLTETTTTKAYTPSGIELFAWKFQLGDDIKNEKIYTGSELLPKISQFSNMT